MNPDLTVRCCCLDPRNSPERDAAVPSPVSLVESLRSLARYIADSFPFPGHTEVCGRLYEAADRIEELEAALDLAVLERNNNQSQLDAVDRAIPEWKGTGRGRIETIEKALGSNSRPVDLASDDRLIPLPGGRVAVVVQDLRVGDVAHGVEVTSVGYDGVDVVAITEGGVQWHYGLGTLVLLDKAAGQ